MDGEAHPQLLVACSDHSPSSSTSPSTNTLGRSGSTSRKRCHRDRMDSGLALYASFQTTACPYCRGVKRMASGVTNLWLV